MDDCSWAPGGKSLNSDIRQKIHEMQTVKHTKSLAEQKAKKERSAKRDCTEGQKGDYCLHVSAKKQRHVAMAKEGRATG